VTRLDVRVHPGARREGLKGWLAGSLKVEVTAAAEAGEANRAVCELLATSLRVGRQRVRVVRGLTSRGKCIEIEGLEPDEVRHRLDALIETGE
jgi:uncharacterized protein YggU (UPF0235/DUF167 family)